MVSEAGAVLGSRPFVAGVGASAGGLEALEELFGAMSGELPVAFVVVQHLSPDFESVMDELLARRTTLPVHRVDDGIRVEAGHVYLIPPRKEMIIGGGRLFLSEKERDGELTLPIDVFFRSLARDAGARSIGVVLSGTGTDGSRGVREIHEAGGLVLVQSPESAKFDGMPKAARDTGVADLVIPIADMPRAITRYVRRGGHLGSDASVPAQRGGVEGILDVLHRKYGIDFSHYKPSTVTRRIERRLLLHQDVPLDRYASMIEGDAGELDSLYRDLLIGVTRFFRDPDAFEFFEKDVLPSIVDDLDPGEELRVWVAGCATGEEAYSIGIAIREQLERAGRLPRAKIFATDVHPGALEQAATGLYAEAALEGVSETRRARWFVREPSCYRVASELRQMVVFAQHNVIADAPFTRLHLVTCRNLLIYLAPEAQQRALSLFHFGLNTGGVLFLGPSESPGALADDFDTVHERWKLYRKERDARLPSDRRLRARGRAVPIPPRAAPSATRLLGRYDAVLARFMPSALLVSDRGELVHAFAGASRFLRVRDGRPSTDLLDLLDPAMKLAVAGALSRVRRNGEPVVYRGIRSEDSDEVVRIRVSRVEQPHGGAPDLLVEIAPDQRPEPRAAPSDVELDVERESQHQVAELTDELRHTKESLQATIEELETSNEELQATNEELVASNEELQSTNEELQSVNEELYTVNAELQRKIEELTQLTNDMDNLLSATDIGTVFLDRDLRIRKFTPHIAATFNLVPHDIGRPIRDFSHNVEHEGLVDEVERVVSTGARLESEVRDRSGRWWFLRILPYESVDGVEGAVLSLVDIGALKRAERELFRARYLLDTLMSTLPDDVYFADERGRFIRINEPFARTLGLASAEAARHRTMSELAPGPAAEAWERAEAEIRATGRGIVNELRAVTDDGGERELWLLETRLPMSDPDGRVVGTFGVARDITQQKRAEDRARDAVRRRDSFLAILSHELRNPLAAIVSGTHLLADGTGGAVAGRSAEALTVLARQSKQMARLLDDLLDVSRIAQDKIELRVEPVDLREVVRDSFETVRPRAETAQVRISVDMPAEVVPVMGDPARLRQIFTNLVANAVKYGRTGGNVWARLAIEGEQAVAEIRDDGVGIPRELLDDVFDMFVQSDDSLARSDGGMGLGLTLVQGLVEMHGGAVSAQSDGVGRGATFVVRFPLTEAPISEVHARPLAMESPSDRTIVVIEDQDDNRRMLTLLLERRGYTVVAASDGGAGLRAIEQHRPAIAIVDIGLPGKDGYEVALEARKRWGSSIRLLALTGYGAPADRRRAREVGFDDHLVKPVEPTALFEALAVPVDADESA